MVLKLKKKKSEEFDFRNIITIMATSHINVLTL